MIQIEDTRTIPQGFWTPTSEREFHRMPEQERAWLLARSEQVKLLSHQDTPLLIAGIYRQSLLAVPFLWVLVSGHVESLPPSLLRALVRKTNEYLYDAETLVEEGNEAAARFAHLFQFKQTSDTVKVGETIYQVYRRVKWLS